MGPFPHDAPPAAISAQNPIGTDGFEFVEFAHPQSRALSPQLFVSIGYVPVAPSQVTKNITVYRQGDINYLLNARARTRLRPRFVPRMDPAPRRWRGGSSMRNRPSTTP